MASRLFVVSGPSGCGKTTIVKKSLELLQEKYPIKSVITYTTRSAREGEIEGRDYHFLSVADFKNKIQEGFFIEWSAWYDHYYGSPVSMIAEIAQGTSYVVILDRPGALNIQRIYPQAYLIWIEPPSLNELKKRLENRAQNETEEIKKRLEKAAIEIEQEHANPHFSYTIKNDDLSVAVLAFIKIVEFNLK